MSAAISYTECDFCLTGWQFPFRNHVKESHNASFLETIFGGWSGGAKVSCTSGHWGAQLILAYSWARPAILVAGKDRRGMFLFLLFLHFHSCSSFFPVLSFISSTISSISFLPVSGRRHKMTHKGWCVVKPQHNQWDHI